MAINTEYSRLLVKRSTVAGVIPTIPTGTTIDNTWLTTDIMVGEMFANVADDRIWIRTDNGLFEIIQSGSTDTNWYTTGATLVGNTVYFDRNDMASAYTVDLSSISLTGDYLPTSGGTLTGDLIINTNLTVDGDTEVQKLSATTITVLNSGATSSQYSDYSGNIIRTGVTNSTIAAGSNNIINSGLSNVFVAGSSITATTSDTAYVTKFNIGNVPTGTSVNNLGIDASGNVIIGSAGTGSTSGDYLPLTGGTMTGDISFEFNKGIKYDASTNVKFEGAFGYTGVTINGGNSSILVGNRYDGGVEISTYEPSAVLGAYTNTGSIEIYDASGIVINDNNKVEIGVDSKEEITLADNTTGATTSTNVDKKAVTIGSRNSKFNSGVVNSVILGGSVITASTSNTVYVPSLNIKTIGSGSSIINLGLDASGNIVTGTTASSHQPFISGSSGSYSIQSNNPLALATDNYGFAQGTSSGTSEFCVAFGRLNLASGSTTFIHGDTNISGAQYGTVFGGDNNTLGNYTFAQGFNHDILGSTNHSAILGGSTNKINASVDRSVILGGQSITATTSDTVYVPNLHITGTTTGVPCDLSFAFSDESTAITTGTTKLTIYAPYAMTITDVRASLSTSGSSLSEFDVNVNGASIFSRRPTIDANEFITATAAAGVPIVSSATVAQDDKITIDIDQAGTGAKGAKIYILGKRNS